VAELLVASQGGLSSIKLGSLGYWDDILASYSRNSWSSRELSDSVRVKFLLVVSLVYRFPKTRLHFSERCEGESVSYLAMIKCTSVDLRFSLSCGMWCRVVRCKFTEVLEECKASAGDGWRISKTSIREAASRVFMQSTGSLRFQSSRIESKVRKTLRRYQKLSKINILWRGA
jgi:hypothetical protein